MRTYILKDPVLPAGYTATKLPDKHCAFCDHCTDVYWDYTNGVYMVCCDKNCKATEILNYNGQCISFVEETPYDMLDEVMQIRKESGV